MITRNVMEAVGRRRAAHKMAQALRRFAEGADEYCGSACRSLLMALGHRGRGL